MSCITMELKAALVLVGLIVLFISSTEAVIPKCCIKTAKTVSKKSLLRVEKWYVQESSGACDTSALILFIKEREKPICAPVSLRPTLEKMERLKRHRKRRAH